MESTILALALSVIRAIVKNPQKKAQMKSVMLKLRDAIDAAFGGE